MTRIISTSVVFLVTLATRKLRTHFIALRHKVKVIQSRPTLCNPMDHTVRGILQARILDWVAFPFSREGVHAAAAAAKSLQFWNRLPVAFTQSLSWGVLPQHILSKQHLPTARIDMVLGLSQPP